MTMVEEYFGTNFACFHFFSNILDLSVIIGN